MRALWKVRCPNPACPKYDDTLARGGKLGARVRGPETRPYAGMPSTDRFAVRVPAPGSPGGAGGARRVTVSATVGLRAIFGIVLMVLGVMLILGLMKKYLRGRGVTLGIALVWIGWTLMKKPEPPVKKPESGKEEERDESGLTGPEENNQEEMKG